MTRMQSARKGILTDDIAAVAAAEFIPPKKLMNDIACGRTVIMRHVNRTIEPLGIGKNLRVKVNANIGTSSTSSSLESELAKLAAAVENGAHAIMDLSTGAGIDDARRAILAASTVPVGTVPVYQVISENDVCRLSEDDFLHGVHRHISDGVDFITIHSGLTHKAIHLTGKRTMGIVSRGGSFISRWMLETGRENPFLSRFNDIMAMALQYDVVLSLGDGLRPGAISDATDRAQLEELKTLGTLAARARKAGVQTIIEGPGHVPLNQVERNIRLQKRICKGAPFYILGPLVTDSAAGYDHIAGAIGGALAAMTGADFLCYLTPREHLGLPDTQDVIEGVIASRIAAHAADIARGIPSALRRDSAMSRARRSLDWPGMFSNALAPRRAEELAGVRSGECTMCGKLCSVRADDACRSIIGGIHENQ